MKNQNLLVIDIKKINISQFLYQNLKIKNMNFYEYTQSELNDNNNNDHEYLRTKF